MVDSSKVEELDRRRRSYTLWQPEQIRTSAGRWGWRVELPLDTRATPAIADGVVYLGNGLGGQGFDAFDARTGRRQWTVWTEDDGPTAVVVWEGRLAFNTVSCTLMVCDAATGEMVWGCWLGDPLTSQPAVAIVDGKPAVVTVYPTGGSHRIAAFDLASGKSLWHTPIPCDVISAPVVANGSIYMALMTGAILRLDANSGRVTAKDVTARATSAPWVHRGRVYYSRRIDDEPSPSRCQEAREGTRATSRADVGDVREAIVSGDTDLTGSIEVRWYRPAPYLARVPRSKRARQMLQDQLDQDESAGLTHSPVTATLEEAATHLGYTASTVSGLWGYTGSRPVVRDDVIYSCLGGTARAERVDDDEPLWETVLVPADFDYRPLTAVVVAGSYVFTVTSDGTLLALDRRTGQVSWGVRLHTEKGVSSQPAVWQDRIYVATDDGLLYCLETGETVPDGDDWPMWGGGPGHNGTVPLG